MFVRFDADYSMIDFFDSSGFFLNSTLFSDNLQLIIEAFLFEIVNQSLLCLDYSMSAAASETVEDPPMARIIKNLLGDLKYLAILKNEVEYGLSTAEGLYESTYEFGRNTYLHPDYRKYFTEEDRKILNEYFPTAFIRLVGYTPGLVNNIHPSMLNVARARRSQVYFAKYELIDLYKELNGNELPTEVTDALKQLEESNNVLRSKISDWTRPSGFRGAEDDPDDVPNLNGVPKCHDWWTPEHREMWKNKTE